MKKGLSTDLIVQEELNTLIVGGKRMNCVSPVEDTSVHFISVILIVIHLSTKKGKHPVGI